MRSWAGILFNFVTGMLIAFLLVLAVSHILGIKFFSVLSGSMEPEYPLGSMVVAVPEQFVGEPKVGDVVSFVADENLTVVTHRVVENNASENTLITQGDANESVDPLVLKANIVGTVIFCVPGMGYPLAYLATTTGKIVAITAIAAALLILAIAQLAGGEKSKKKLVITFNDKHDLTPQALSNIAEGLKEKGIDIRRGQNNG